jgi:DNA polymerase-3 subunit epsilon
MRFTAIDFETATADRASVCAVGLAVVEDGQIVSRVSQLIRPQPLVFAPFNISIHGITEEDVADAPTFAEYWPSLWSNVQGPLAAHNASFDMSCLRHALDQCGTPYPETDYYCTRVLSRLAWPQHPTYALDHIAQSLGIVFQHHDAEEDAVACALILLAACRRVNARTLADLQDTLGVRVGRICKGGYWPCGGPYALRAYDNQRPQLRASDIVPGGERKDESHSFCGKVFVFTGALSSMERRQAMQAVVDCGGFCRDRVNTETDYLVLGQEGFRGYQAGHKSAKMRKAEEMRGKGAPIEIMSESDFLSLL